MSRGPGKVERAIEAAFASRPDDIWPLGELAEAVYRGINRVEKKHRVAVGRAARNVCARKRWTWVIPLRMGAENVYYNLASLRSYCIGRMHGFWELSADITTRDLCDAFDGLDAPLAAKWFVEKNASYWQEGGVWQDHVHWEQLRQSGREDEARRLEAEWEERTAPERERQERLMDVLASAIRMSSKRR